MREFLLALQFLTVIPVKWSVMTNERQLPRSLAFFPVIGLLIGLILAGINSILTMLSLERLLVCVVLVVALIIVTGGLHLDGLADTFDAILSRKNKDEMLRIMRDPHIGTMGVLSVISVTLLKVSLLYSLSQETLNISLLLMCLLSRYSLVFSVLVFPYAREDGKAKVFINGINWKIFSAASVIALISAFAFFKFNGLICLAVAVLFAYVFGKFIARKIGGITGDTLGATNELVEVVVLCSIFVMEKCLML